MEVGGLRIPRLKRVRGRAGKDAIFHMQVGEVSYRCVHVKRSTTNRSGNVYVLGDDAKSDCR